MWCDNRPSDGINLNLVQHKGHSDYCKLTQVLDTSSNESDVTTLREWKTGFHRTTLRESDFG